ncbi:MAG: hypothetical protein AABN95_09560 [Acidobacteriota bacterium]
MYGQRLEELHSVQERLTISPISASEVTEGIMKKFRQILEQSLQLAASNKLDEALSQLNEGVRNAAKEEDPKWLILLAKNAGLLFEKQGKLDRAKASYRLALKHSKSDPYLHYSLAEICLKLGQAVAARRHIAACRKLAESQNDEDLLEILKRRNHRRVAGPGPV